jgi:hypothetical protein
MSSKIMHNFLNLALDKRKDTEIVATTRQGPPQGGKGLLMVVDHWQGPPHVYVNLPDATDRPWIEDTACQ